MTIRHYKVKEFNRFTWDIQEALVKKYDIILTDYKEPLTKLELGFKIGKAIYLQLNKRNLDKCIGMIQKSTSMLSEFGKAFDNPKRQNQKSSDVRSAFWGESKESKKETMSFYSKKKMDFW